MVHIKNKIAVLHFKDRMDIRKHSELELNILIFCCADIYNTLKQCFESESGHNRFKCLDLNYVIILLLS